MKKAIPRRVIAGFCAGFITLALAAFLPYHAAQLNSQGDARIARTETVMASMAQLSGAIAAAQNAQRGFLLTHQPQYREAFEIQQRVADDTLAQLQSDLADNPQQSQRMVYLQAQLDEQLRALHETLAPGSAAEQEPLFDGPLPVAQERSLRQFQRRLQDAMQIERSMLDQRVDQLAESARYYQLGYSALMLLIVLVFARLYWFIRQTFILRSEQAERLKKQRNLLDSIITSTVDGLFVSGLDGRVILTNPAFDRLIFREADANWQDTWRQHYQLFTLEGESLSELQLPTRKVIEGEQASTLEFLVRSLGTGEERYLKAAASPYCDADGQLRGAVCIISDITEQKRTEQSLREVHKRVVRSLGELALRNKEISALNHASQALQACDSEPQTYQVLVEALTSLLPYCSGAIYLRRQDSEDFQLIRDWGRERPLRRTFPAADCWGLKRGAAHVMPGAHGGHTEAGDSGEAGWALACLHEEGPEPGYPSLCAPVSAHGDILGLLYIQDTSSASQPTLQPDSCSMVTTLAVHAGLAISGLRLRESLRTQTIQDALTGLYNRRYLEAGLIRELGNAERQSHPLAVMMIDVDHFKRINDQFGHDSGDAALIEIARVLKSTLRVGDMACRFGGEEFAIVLPKANAESAQQCAERILQAVRGIDLAINQQPLGRLSVSIGIALFPLHGTSAPGLLKAADLALYQAKRLGRDRTVSALG